MQLAAYAATLTKIAREIWNEAEKRESYSVYTNSAACAEKCVGQFQLNERLEKTISFYWLWENLILVSIKKSILIVRVECSYIQLWLYYIYKSTTVMLM